MNRRGFVASLAAMFAIPRLVRREPPEAHSPLASEVVGTVTHISNDTITVDWST